MPSLRENQWRGPIHADIIPDYAAALRELMELPRKQRPAFVYAVSLIPLGFGVFVIILAILR